MSGFATFLKEKLGARQKRALRKGFRGLLSVVPHDDNLELLAMKYGTDKQEAFGGHGYLKHYQNYFSRLRGQKLKILEIGIGGYKDPEVGAGSLKMWRDYFPNSAIHGLDIEDKSDLGGERITIHQGDQSDPEFLRKLATEIGPLDIVIDDGSHFSEHVIISFNALFPLLADSGIYVVEDTHTSYQEKFGGNSGDLDSTATSLGFLKRLTDGLNCRWVPDWQASYTDRHVAGVHFYPEIVFVLKRPSE